MGAADSSDREGEGRPARTGRSGERSVSEERTARWLLGVAIAVGLLLRGWLALRDQGIYWPDEIYQSLEPAHRLVFGYGFVPWEFIKGVRNWTFPGLVAGLLALVTRLGLSSPAAYVAAIKLVFAALGAATGWATARLARAAGASPLGAALAGTAFLLAAPAIYFAPRAMSGTACALPVALGLAFVLDPTSSRGRRLAGGALLGLAVLIRIQCGLFCAALLAVLLARAVAGRQGRERWGPVAECAGMLGVFAFVYGLIDRLTWGGWFHSAIAYLRFNLVEGKASRWGTAGKLYYVHTLFTSMPFLAVLLLAGVVLACKRARGLAFIGLVFVLVHSLVPHKELRFVFADLPLLFALAGVGLDSLSGRVRRVGMAALVAAAVISAATFHTLRFGDIGAYLKTRPHVSAYDDAGAINRLLLRAYHQPDLCGLKMAAHDMAWTGGYTYLHRDVPLYARRRHAPRHAYNYAIVRRPFRHPPVATDGKYALVRLFRGRCRKDPRFSWRLP